MSKIISFLFLFFVASTSSAQNTVTRVSADPDLNYAVVDVNGQSHLIDGVTNRVIVADQYGNLEAFTFDEVALKIANGNTTNGIGLSAELDSALYDRTLIFTLTNSTQPRVATQDYFNDLQKDGGGGDFELQAIKKQKLKDISTSMITDKVDGAGSGLGGPCDFSPCTPIMRDKDGKIIYFRYTTSGVIGIQNITQQAKYAADYNEWKKAKAGVCNSAIDAAEDTTIAGTAAAASCPYVGTGAGALVCAASVATVLILNQRLARYTKACHSTYPGPGKW